MLKTSDQGVYAKEVIVVVLKCEQRLVISSAIGVGGAAVVGDWLWNIIERVRRLLRNRSMLTTYRWLQIESE